MVMPDPTPLELIHDDIVRLHESVTKDIRDVRADIHNLNMAVMGDGANTPGIAGRVAAIERTEAGRTKLLWTAITASATAFGAFLVKFVSPDLFKH
jgi:hypothetical protein